MRLPPNPHHPEGEAPQRRQSQSGQARPGTPPVPVLDAHPAGRTRQAGDPREPDQPKAVSLAPASLPLFVSWI